MSQEFLPACDLIFNVISLISYFGDVVFDLIMVYTLYDKEQYVWFSLALSCIIISLLASQIMSITWYLRKISKDERAENCEFGVMLASHLVQCGVVWRYFKLFVPVDLRYVKRAVRDLSLLRLLHAFCEAAPMLLIELYFMWKTSPVGELTHVNVVSAISSLFSVCWALASFNKHIRQRNLHKLVLTWLGVFSQLLWRIGTISSRFVALTFYATLYHFWVFLVIGLHWISMFLWLISPKNVFHGEKLSRTKKCVFSLLISYVYIFCYINLQEVNAKQKMIAFYSTMFLENTLLMVVVWLNLQTESPWLTYTACSLVWGGFALGIVFMLVYYRFCHVNRLNHVHAAGDSFVTCTACQLGSCSVHDRRCGYVCGGQSLSAPFAELNGGGPKNGSTFGYFKGPHQLHKLGNVYHGDIAYIPGVFNCRLNPALKRKKKKPTSFVPVPVPHISMNSNGGATLASPQKNPKMDSVPFWKKPLPKLVTDDADRCRSRADIQQKLLLKKQQQLQELRVIEEEIKQGKLQRPHPTDISEQGTLRQPIPRAKKQPWVPADGNAPRYRSKTPEVLLAPHYLEHARVYYDYSVEKWRFAPVNDNGAISTVRGLVRHPKEDHRVHDGGDNEDEDDDKGGGDLSDVLYKMMCRIPSDLDSQISLPRSYTLPREFRYHRKPKSRKTVRSEHFITSTNSSDGDVDSGDEELQQSAANQKAYRNMPNVVSAPRNRAACPSHCNATTYNLHETKL